MQWKYETKKNLKLKKDVFFFFGCLVMNKWLVECKNYILREKKRREIDELLFNNVGHEIRLGCGLRLKK